MMADEERQGIIPGGEQIAQEPTLVASAPRCSRSVSVLRTTLPRCLPCQLLADSCSTFRDRRISTRLVTDWNTSGLHRPELAHFLAELAASLFAELLRKIFFKRCAQAYHPSRRGGQGLPEPALTPGAPVGLQQTPQHGLGRQRLSVERHKMRRLHTRRPGGSDAPAHPGGLSATRRRNRSY